MIMQKILTKDRNNKHCDTFHSRAAQIVQLKEDFIYRAISVSPNFANGPRSGIRGFSSWGHVGKRSEIRVRPGVLVRSRVTKDGILIMDRGNKFGPRSSKLSKQSVSHLVVASDQDIMKIIKHAFCILLMTTKIHIKNAS
jgi:hypothetical protein